MLKMNRISRYVVGISILMAVTVLAFWQLPFRAAWSQTEAQREMESFSLRPNGEVLPRDDRLRVRVTGEGGSRLTSSLEESLQEQLSDRPYSMDVSVLNGPADDPAFPFLLVELPELSGIWTPVFARTHLTARLVFTSNGDLSWRDDSPVRMTNERGAVFWMRGKIELEDHTRGLISLPAYREHLATEIAKQIAQAVDEMRTN
jgi:hypothetical protein